MSQVERIEVAEAEILRQRADQRLVAAFAQAARHARQGHEQIGLEPAFGRRAEDVQAVADLGFLEVAEVGIEALQVAGRRRR